MKKKNFIIIGVIALFLLCSYFLLDQLIHDYQTPKKEYSGNGYVYFDPENILYDLENNIPVFTQEIEYNAKENDTENSPDVKIFTENEYMFIAERFFESKWKENVSDWNLVNIKFVLYDCNRGLSGNVLAKYQYEKKSNDDQNKILERVVTVIPWANTISWSESILEYTQLASKIHWDNISISATNAFQISNQYGNEHLDENWDVYCDEVVLLLVSKRKNIWYVNYRGPFDELLSVEINANTGKLKEK